MDETKINAVIVQRGSYFMGRRTQKLDGTIEEQSARWEPDAKGASIIVCEFDTEKGEPVGDADLFAWWDTVGIEERVREQLALTRQNFPTPEELYRWIKEWDGRGLDICDICEGICAGYDCRVCPIQVIRDETEDMSEDGDHGMD